METAQNKSETAAKKLAAEKKYERLMAELAALPGLAVAFSGGVDSTFLAMAAKEALAERCVALLAVSAVLPQREREDAERFASRIGIRLIEVDGGQEELREFVENSSCRCYHCKKNLMGKLLKQAEQEGFELLAEASNLDDEGEYRPGMQAVRELGILSPLRKAGLTKAEIRLLSKERGLETWNKPSFACLASRIPYGQTITREKLRMVEEAEEVLWEMGFTQGRVRHHGEIARIELLGEEKEALLTSENARKLCKALEGIGFRYVAVDLRGYRTGSMDEGLKEQERKGTDRKDIH